MTLRADRKPGITFTYKKASTVASMLAFTLPGMVIAAEQQNSQSESVLATIKVQATKDKPVYQTDKAQSTKFTQPLRDTPKTITVINKTAIEDQNLLSLREILSTVPGITFGAGEGGGGFGDKINIRGFSGENNIAVDGMRDSAQFSRTDPFNIEQIDVVKGSSSAESGAGASGGTINLVSKTPKLKNSVDISTGIGTDGYYRFTADANQKLDETTAARVNLMLHRNDVPGRDVEQLERWGIAPSITFGLGTPTRFTLAYFHQQDDNTPQYGIPYYNGRPVDGISTKNYYGYSNIDEQHITNDALTAIFEHEFNDAVSLRSILRGARVDQLSNVSAPQAGAGGFCLNNGLSPAGWTQGLDANRKDISNVSGYVACAKAYTATPSTTVAPNYVVSKDGPVLAPGQYAASGPRGNVRDTTNTIVANQTDATWKFNTGSIGHTLVTGFAISHETYDFDGSRDFKNANGWDLSGPQSYGKNGVQLMNVYDPDNTYYGPLNRTLTGKNEADQDARAIYLFDTLKFSPEWQASFGLRYDRIEGKNTTFGVKTYTVPVKDDLTTKKDESNPDNSKIGSLTGQNSVTNYGDDLLSYNAGIVYKPQPNISIYASYANAENPTITAVNANCTANSTTGANNCTSDPEKAVTYELGTKWDVVNNKLSLTAALFSTERTNYKVSDPGNPLNPNGFQVLDGRSRVQGLELGAAGLITRNWSVFANLTGQTSKVLRGASAFSAAGGANGTVQDWTKGDQLTQVPEIAASLWTTYDIDRQWQVGYGATYQGSMYLTQHGGIQVGSTGVYTGRTTIPLAKSEGYIVHNASVTYKYDRHLSVQLNVKNILDEEYYTRIRNNGWATPGDGRSAVLNVNYHF